MIMESHPSIRKHLLWEYDWETFDFSTMARVVIERVIERGNMEEWKEIVRYYGKENIQKVVESSPRLSSKDKQFTPIFLQSKFLE